jgi:hypothetical protein
MVEPGLSISVATPWRVRKRSAGSVALRWKFGRVSLGCRWAVLCGLPIGADSLAGRVSGGLLRSSSPRFQVAQSGESSET